MASLSSQLDPSENSFLAPRSSLYECRENFTERISPVSVAAIFFGAGVLGSRDVALGRQALLKLSYAFRHFLCPLGFSVRVNHQTAIFQEQNGPSIYRQLAKILAQQIAGIQQVILPPEAVLAEAVRGVELEGAKLKAALSLDAQGRPTLAVQVREGRLRLEGLVASEAERSALGQLAQTVCREEVINALNLDATLVHPARPEVDDDSLRSFVLFRLWLTSAAGAGKVRVSANRGTVLLQGKIATAAERQAIDQMARTTLGVHRLRNSLVVVEKARPQASA